MKRWAWSLYFDSQMVKQSLLAWLLSLMSKQTLTVRIRYQFVADTATFLQVFKLIGSEPARNAHCIYRMSSAALLLFPMSERNA